MNVFQATPATASSPNPPPPTEVGRLVFRLARESHPRTCENFKLFCQGTVIPFDKKAAKDQKVFSYVNTPFTRVTEDGIQGGNIHKLYDPTAVVNSAASAASTVPAAGGRSSGNNSRSGSPAAGQRSSSPGAGGGGTVKEGGKNVIPESQLQSVYGPVFADENRGVIPFQFGTLAMCNSSAPDTNGCQFFICTTKPHPTNYELTLASTEHLLNHYVSFGELVEGAEVLELVSSGMSQLTVNESGDVRGAPIVYVVGSCGVLGGDVTPQASSSPKK